MKGFMLCLLSCLSLTGCVKKEVKDQTTLKQDEAFRPIVAVVPILDSSKNTLDWNLSDELTGLVSKRLFQRNRFYLPSPMKVKNFVRRIPASCDPFDADIAWMKSAFEGNEFAVFAEVIEHNEAARVPHTAQITTSNIQNCSADLNITIRLRIVDLRPFEPKIILQEMIHDTHHIPRQFTRANFYQVSWENEHFHISPLGLAHAELVKDLCNRLEEYILRTRDF